MGMILRPYLNLLNPGPKQVPRGRLQVDWSHPLAKGLVACFVPGTQEYNLADSSNLTLVMGDNGVNQEGSAFSGADTYSAQFPANSSIMTSLQISSYVRGYMYANATPNAVWFSLSWNIPNSLPWGVAILNGSGSGFPFTPRSMYPYSVNSQSLVNFGNSITGAGRISLGHTINYSANPIAFENYFNGAFSNSGSNGAGGSRPTHPAGRMTISGGFSSSTLNCVYMWNRILSAEEMRWIDREPYCFLVPDNEEFSIIAEILLIQSHFRFRTDTNAVDATPTWGAAEDAGGYDPGASNFRLRVSVANTGAAVSEQPFELYLSKNSGAYAPITTTSTGGVKSADASTDADETAIRIPRLTPGT